MMNYHAKEVKVLNLKIHRLASGLSQWEVGKRARISQGRYSMIERGLIKPTEKERERLARILQAPGSTLFRPACRAKPVAAIASWAE